MAEIENEKKDLFKLDSVKCVSCIHLFPTHPSAKSHVSCHFSKGNENCPAQEIRFVIAVDKKSKIDNLRESFKNDDVPAVIEQLNKLVKLSKDERRGLLSELLNIEVKPKKKKIKKD